MNQCVALLAGSDPDMQATPSSSRMAEREIRLYTLILTDYHQGGNAQATNPTWGALESIR